MYNAQYVDEGNIEYPYFNYLAKAELCYTVCYSFGCKHEFFSPSVIHMQFLSLPDQSGTPINNNSITL